MKTFDVYNHPTLGYQAVKQGFSWPAFCFTAIWAFVKRMWGLGLAIIGIYLIFVLIEAAFDNQGGVLLVLLVEVAFYILIGFKANDWRRRFLQKRGFEKLRTVQAETPDAAIGSVAKEPLRS